MNELDVRRHLVEALEADLVGPFVADSHPQGGQEVLPIAPSRWYLTGFLAPQGGRKPDEDDQDSVDGGLAAGDESQAEDGGSEEGDHDNKRPVRFPASMGVSVFLPPGRGDAIEVDVWYADYDKIELPIEHTDKKRIGWKRVPHGPVRVAVPLDVQALQKPDGIPVPGSRGLILRGELRTTDMEPRSGHARAEPLPRERPRAGRARSRPAVCLSGSHAARVRRWVPLSAEPPRGGRE